MTPRFADGRRATRWGRLVVFALAALAIGCLVGCGSCSDSDDKEESGAEERDAGQQADGESAADEMEQRRQAFGIPFPPSVLHVRDEGKKVHVQTDMSLDELEDFYEARLTDYEVLNSGSDLRVIGLREYMASVHAYRYAGRTQVVHFAPEGGGARAEKSSDDDSSGDRRGQQAGRDDDQKARSGSSGTGRSARAGSKPISKRKKGEPVMDRTADGERLAPGARWGEPYTPPEGSPLDQKRFESNFGKPYGEWVAQ
ncbi:MAG: hypothetical protein ACOCV2_05575 [Persicimonas sp.]